MPAKLQDGQVFARVRAMRATPPRTAGKAAKCTPVDEYIGLRIRQQRNALGLSQTALANALGLTFQQIQKYERGFNRVSAATLFAMAKVLHVPISYFFDGADVTIASQDTGNGLSAFMNLPEAHKLVGALPQISNSRLRRALIHLVCDLAECESVHDG